MTDRRLLIAALALVVPWTVIIVGGDVELVFAWGLLDSGSLHAVSITAYLFEHTSGLPEYLLAWPTSVVLYALGVASIAGGVALDREDRRVTAGLLVLAGLAYLRFATGIGARGGRVAVPVATALLWSLAWWNRPPALFR